jgi:biotin synthase
VATVHNAARAGLSPCSGVIVGMGETDEQLVDVALSLRELRPGSVPVNFLMPFDGTPLAGKVELTPARCLRVLAMFRFFFPDVEVRIAGGREMHLRSLQVLGLHIANSIFLGDYLTSEGAEGRTDLQMIADGGFVVEGAAGEVPASAGKGISDPQVVPPVRRRGPGTGLPANV